MGQKESRNLNVDDTSGIVDEADKQARQLGTRDSDSKVRLRDERVRNRRKWRRRQGYSLPVEAATTEGTEFSDQVWPLALTFSKHFSILTGLQINQPQVRKRYIIFTLCIWKLSGSI